MKVIYEDTVYERINKAIEESKLTGRDVKEIHLNQYEFDQLTATLNISREVAPYQVPEWNDARPPLWFRDYCWIRCPRT